MSAFGRVAEDLCERVVDALVARVELVQSVHQLHRDFLLGLVLLRNGSSDCAMREQTRKENALSFAQSQESSLLPQSCTAKSDQQHATVQLSSPNDDLHENARESLQLRLQNTCKSTMIAMRDELHIPW